MKKRLLTLATCCLMVIGMLTGCGNKDSKVKEEIVGQYWGYDFYASAVDQHCHKLYVFKEDSVDSYWVNDEVPDKNSKNTGTYEVKDGKITITYTDSEDVDVIEYSYDGDTLELIDKGSDGSLNNELRNVTP